MHNQTIRVLQVLGILDRGGAETMIMNLYRNVDREKLQFDFVVHTSRTGAYDAEVAALGGRIFHAPEYRVINHLQYVWWWKQFLKKHPEYVVVHSHIRSTASLFLPIVKSFGRKTIIHSHSTSDGSGIKAITKHLLRCNITKHADYLFACSDVAGQWLFGKTATERKPYYVLNNAIDVKRFAFDADAADRVRTEFGLQQMFLMGTVGRITPQKNPFGIIKIIKSVCGQCDDARFLWVGTGELEDAVKAQVRAEGLEQKVIFCGVRSDIPELLSAMDVFVFPSNWEGLPVSVIEAQASGVTCLLSDTITEAVCITPAAVRLPLQDVALWTEHITRIRENSHRIETAEAIKDAGYDINTTAAWLQNFYLEQA